MEDLLQRQIALERSVLPDGEQQRLATEELFRLAENPSNDFPPMSEFLTVWLASRSPRSNKAGKFLLLINPIDAIQCTVEEIVAELVSPNLGESFIGDGSYRAISLAIGRRCMRLVGQSLWKGRVQQRDPELKVHDNLKFSSTLMKHYSRDTQNWESLESVAVEHDDADLLRVGTVLLDHIVHTTSLFEESQPKGMGDKKVVCLTDTGREFVTKYRLWRKLPPRIPMLMPPFPHNEDAPAGYFHHDELPLPLIKLKETGEQEKLVKASPGYRKIAKSVNAMQAIGWRINKRVAEVYSELRKENEGMADIGIRHEFTPNLSSNMSHAERKDELARLGKLRADNAEEEQRESLIELYWNEEAFYYPHWCDWRGRSYVDCTNTVFSHQGDKVGRGLLEFAEGAQVNSIADMEGLFVQAALCDGKDKLPRAEKIRLYSERLEELAEIGRGPLSNRTWLDADKPLQFLQCCIAFADYIDSDGHFNCHVPCETDGSQSGFQHYAAVTRSCELGLKVNLAATAERNDLYEEVLSQVATSLPRSKIGGFWKEHLDRDVIKGPTLIVIYGSGATKRLEEAVAKLKKKLGKNTSPKLIESIESKEYQGPLKVAIEGALDNVAEDAMSAMGWLKEAAKLRACYYDYELEGCFAWVSQIGLPIRNYKGIDTERQVQVTPLSDAAGKGSKRPKVSHTVYENPTFTHDIQVAGVAANFIQSQDASHLHLTSIAAAQRSMAFVGVHDAFITHTTQLAPLNVLLRETFVEMYKGTDPLTSLYKSLDQGIITGGHISLALDSTKPLKPLPKPPPQRDLDLTEILANEYFFA